ncbi:MAG: hypothetical protein MJ193_05655, partial [Clostridia bacterium]|nr:hypothetical protein [Clostridia bacterium]
MNDLDSRFTALSIKFYDVKLSPTNTSVTKTYGDTISGSDWFTGDGLSFTTTYYDATSGAAVTPTNPVSAGSYKMGFVVKKTSDGSTVGTYTASDGLTLTVNKKSLTGFSSTSASIYQGAAFPASSYTLSASGLVSGHTLSYSVSSNYNQSAVQTGSFNVTYSNIKVMSGGTDVSANYSYTTPQTFTGYLTVNRGDFGRNSIDKWGTSTNPYLIENADDLARLSKIVNGDVNPINSIVGYGDATATNVVATDRTYSGAYFKLTADISNPSVASTPSSYTNYSTTAAGNSGEGIEKLFDGNTGTKYCTPTGSDI